MDSIFAEDSPHMHPFAAVETQHKQLSFYRRHFDFSVWKLMKYLHMDNSNFVLVHNRILYALSLVGIRVGRGQGVHGRAATK